MKQLALILLGLGLLVVLLAAYAFVSLPFSPPPAQTSLAVVPPPLLPRHNGAPPEPLSGPGNPAETPHQVASAPNPQSPDKPKGEAGNAAEQPPPQTAQEPPAKPSTADAVMQDFFSRHKSLPETMPEGITDKLHQRLFQIACCILDRSESRDTLIRLLSDSDPQIRRSTVEALWDASMALRSTDEKGETVWRGSATLAGLWREIDDRQMDVALDAIVATLIEAVQRGTVSSTPVVLSLMEDRALPAVPHLIWASDNSPSYLMRLAAMSVAESLAPNAIAVQELLQRRGMDPDNRVRLVVWSVWLRSWVVRQGS